MSGQSDTHSVHAPLLDPDWHPLAGAIRQDDYDVDTPWHAHELHQLQYAFDGIVEVEDEGGAYLLPRALAAWIPAGVSHRTRIHYVRSGSVYLCANLVPDAGDRVRIIQVSSLMREMILEAMRWPLNLPLNDLGTKYFNAFAALCAEWIAEEAPLRMPRLRETRLADIANYTYDNLSTVTLATVCDLAGMSERTFRRHFRATAGMSWESFRQRARLLRAAAELSNGRQAIGVVAAQVGFESQSAFARAFKELIGINPREFAKRDYKT